MLAAIDEHTVAQKAHYYYLIPLAIKQQILAIRQGQAVTLSRFGQLDTKLRILFAGATLSLLRQTGMALLVSAFHHELLANPQERRIVLNIGGIANLSLLCRASRSAAMALVLAICC